MRANLNAFSLKQDMAHPVIDHNPKPECWNSLLFTLYPLPFTLYPLPSTLHPLPFTLYPLPFTLYPLP